MRAAELCAGAFLAAGVFSQALAAPAKSARGGLLDEVAGRVEAAELKASIDRLVGFGTRHTLSGEISSGHGIEPARVWVRRQFSEIGRRCNGCLTVETPSQTFTGERLPGPTAITDVLAIQRGATDPERVIVISGHLDSRVADVMNATANAPGADDDGSGTAAVIEAARVLSRYRFPATLVFAVTSGEEQGLYGGRLLASYARAHHWSVEAALNNDIVGGVRGANGARVNAYVRVFSEGTRSVETPEDAARRRYNGGEVDSPSRNLARFISNLAIHHLNGFRVRMIYRTDRFNRGGDQVPMLAEGYPAVRFTEAIENYDREHQDVRVEHGVRYGDTPDGVDIPYLANVTRLNAMTMAALALAPAPPPSVKVSGAVSLDTTVTWTSSPGASRYRVWWRDTTAPEWSESRLAPAGANSLPLKNVNIDDYFFGVSAISAGGFDSPVEFPGPAGAFASPPGAPASR